MLGLFRLLRLAALRELRGGWMLMIGAASLLVIAAALVALPLVFRAASADLALRELIEQSPRGTGFADHARAFRPAETEDFAQVAEDAELIRERHLRRFGGLLGDTRRIMETPRSFARFTRLDNEINESLLAYLMSFDGLSVHSRLVRGEWARGVNEAVIGSELASDLSLDVGSEVVFAEDRRFVVTGIIEPTAADPSQVLAFHYTNVWFDLQVNITQGGAEEPYFGLFVNQAALERFGSAVTHRMRTELMTGALNSDQVDDAIEALSAWQQQSRRLESGSAGTLLLSALESFSRQAQFSASQSLLAGLQIAAVAMFGVALVGRVMAQRTRVDRERLAARGARPWQQAGAQAVLGAIAAVPAALLGAPLAAFALSHAGRLEAVARVSGGEPFDTRLTWEAWALAVGGALIAWIAFATPAWFDARKRENQRVAAGRPQRQSLFQRAWLDVALLALAAVLFFQFESEASGGALAAFESGGMNPVLMLSPGLLLLGSALTIMRVAPRVWGLAAAALSRAPIASWLYLGVLNVARNPTGPMLLTALVAFITAVGLISATYASTIRTVERSRIEYEVGSDVRGVSIGGNLATSTIRRVTEPLDRRDGIQAGAAYRGIGSVGGDREGSRVVVLGLETGRLSETVALDDDLLGASSDEVLAAIGREPGRIGQALPEGAEALTIDVRSDPGNSNLELAARVLDGNGQVHMRQFRTNTASAVGGEMQTMRAPLGGLTQPLRIAAIIMRPHARVVRAPTGTLHMRDLRALVGEDSIAVESFESAGPWFSASGGAGEDRIEFRGGELRYHWSQMAASDERIIVRESPNLPVNAAMDRTSMETADLKLGDVVPIELNNASIPVRITATVDYFPTLNPAQGGFLIADVLALRSAALLAAVQAVLPITEVWASTETNAGRLITNDLLDEVYLASTVLDAEERIVLAEEDPFRSGGAAALFVVGFIGLLVVGSAALIFTLAAAGGERAREFALMRTIGAGRSGLTGQAAVEVGLVLAAGVALGFGLGRAIVGALLAFLDVTAEGIAAAPPTVLSVDWVLAGIGVGVIVTCAIVGTTVISRWATGQEAAPLLREGAD
ncbi:MAG: ABC transporter permease [Chloroflexi bacterium]|nr:ABC transporter permease [Chloroflexota bacterium]